MCILQCATRSKVKILARYTKTLVFAFCEGQINFLFGKCELHPLLKIKHCTDSKEAILTQSHHVYLLNLM